MNAKNIAEQFAGQVLKIAFRKSGPFYDARVVAWKSGGHGTPAYVGIEVLPPGESKHKGEDFKPANGWTWTVDQAAHADKPVIRVPAETVMLPPGSKTDAEIEAAAEAAEEAKAGPRPAWEVMMRVINPSSTRPRRTSLHTLATVLGHPDPLALAKEMKDSGKVVGYVCPDVQTPIFYLKALCKLPGMIDTRDEGVWSKLPAFFEKNPYPQVKGFKRFAGGTWAGGSYGKGSFKPTSSAMDVPYEKDDYPYARKVVEALIAAGHKPGIEPPVG